MQNEVIFISGQRGSGKSFFAKQLARSFTRFIIFDTLGEYEADQRFFNYDELLDFLIQDESNPHFFRIAFDHHDPQETFPFFCRIVLAVRNVHLLIEEIDLFSTPLATDPNFLKLLKYGRHYGIQIVGISRRPAEVSRAFTSQCNRMVIFEQREPRDIMYFRSYIGNEADLIPNLANHKYLDVDFKTNPVTIEMCEPLNLPNSKPTPARSETANPEN